MKDSIKEVYDEEFETSAEVEIVKSQQFKTISDKNKRLQQFNKKEDLMLGFIYDSLQQCIIVLDLSTMQRHTKVQ